VGGDHCDAGARWAPRVLAVNMLGEAVEEDLSEPGELVGIANLVVVVLTVAGAAVLLCLIAAKTAILVHYLVNRTSRGHELLRRYTKLCGYDLRSVELAERPGPSFRQGLASPLLELRDPAEAQACERLRGIVLAGCGACGLLLVAVACVLAHVGWLQVSRAANGDAWHDARVTPAQFPRYMGCGACRAGNKTDAELRACAEPCFGVPFVRAWESFAGSQPWRLVFFPSRPGPGAEGAANVSAWWLPADPSRLPPGRPAPRIVALHGLGSNNNHCGVQSACFLLRTMGFSCLTPTVRDYGLSGPSSHPTIMSWGYDYQNDLLGAWDYARRDPDGVLGGPLPASQVGIMGFSKGALAAANAFGLEPRIPAAWIDSAPYTGLYGMIDAKVRPYAGPLTPVIRDPVWWAAQHFSGLELDRYLPLNLLRNCTGPPRRVAISQGMLDMMVPIDEGNTAVDFLSGLVECYRVTPYTPPAVCDGDSHHSFMWEFPDSARRKLCSFWSAAFGRNTSVCGLEALPSFQTAVEAERLPRPPLRTAR